MLTIDVLYSCKTCGIDEHPVPVPARASTEDVVWWMNNVCMPAIGASHAQQSPRCPADVADIMIPIPAGTGGWVGGPQIN